MYIRSVQSLLKNQIISSAINTVNNNRYRTLDTISKNNISMTIGEIDCVYPCTLSKLRLALIWR